MIQTFYAHGYAWLARAAQLDLGPLPNRGDDPALYNIETAVQIVLAVMGSVAVLIIVISGLRYILASGDPGKMAQAKNAIIYALVGLAVLLSAFSIVTFVVKGLG